MSWLELSTQGSILILNVNRAIYRIQQLLQAGRLVTIDAILAGPNRGALTLVTLNIDMNEVGRKAAAFAPMSTNAPLSSTLRKIYAGHLKTLFVANAVTLQGIELEHSYTQ